MLCLATANYIFKATRISATTSSPILPKRRNSTKIHPFSRFIRGPTGSLGYIQRQNTSIIASSYPLPFLRRTATSRTADSTFKSTSGGPKLMNSTPNVTTLNRCYQPVNLVFCDSVYSHRTSTHALMTGEHHPDPRATHGVHVQLRLEPLGLGRSLVGISRGLSGDLSMTSYDAYPLRHASRDQ